MSEHILPILDALADCRRASRMKSRRNFADFLADRIVQAATEPTLLSFVNRLYGLIDADPAVGSAHVAAIIRANGSEDGPRLLAWIRANPKIVSMLAMISREERAEVAPAIVLDAEPGGSGSVPARENFDIQIEATLTAPLAHGADTKAGNATLFRRMQARADNGAVLELPFYAGNALRGILRDILADHFLTALGLTARKDEPPCHIWFFHALYAGGSLEEDSKATKAIADKFGRSAGSINGGGVREFREMIPPLSLLGCALGNRVLEGRIKVSDLRPRCREWGNGDGPAGELLSWQYLTRRDDHEGRAAEDKHEGMIAVTETLRPGVMLEGGIDISGHCSEIERSALDCGLSLLAARGYLGAESRRGHGRCEIHFDAAGDPGKYEAWLGENRKKILTYLTEIAAIDDAAGDPEACGVDPNAEPAGAF